MSLFSRFSEKEKTMMTAYIDNYAVDKREVSLEKLLSYWDSAKSEYLFDMFGKEFTYSKNVEFKKGVDELAEELEEVFDNNEVIHEFIREYSKKILKPYLDSCEDGSWEAYRELGYFINSYELADNIYRGTTRELVCPFFEKPLKIQHGCKLTRTLAKIAEGFGISGYEEFRIAHSQVLNQKSLKGTLTFSIHPMDYMTMSDNDCGWSSCMSWQEDGCYRQGTVEMMNSPMVVVGYLKSNSDMYVPGRNPETDSYDIKWNSKKWRQLFIVTPDLVCNVKSYPYRNDNLTKVSLECLKELAENANIGTYEDKVLQYDSFTEFEYKGVETTINPHTELMYNDFSDKQFAYLSKNFEGGRLSFDYSGYSECLSCGNIHCEFDGEGKLAGMCCEQVYYCDCCGDSYDSEDDMIWIDDVYLCQYCYNDVAMTDDITGEVHHQDNMISIRLVDENLENFDDSKEIYTYFRHLRDLDFMFKYFKTLIRISADYFVKVSDLTDEGKSLFYDLDNAKFDLDIKNYVSNSFDKSLINSIYLHDSDSLYFTNPWNHSRNNFLSMNYSIA